MSEDRLNEIKEILDFLLYNDKLTTSGKRKLRDYITNLQQELETRQYDIDNLTYMLAKKIEEKEYLDKLRNANYLSWQDSLSRIEKAVKYIENDDNFWVALGEDCGKPNDDLDKLLNILNGESDE